MKITILSALIVAIFTSASACASEGRALLFGPSNNLRDTDVEGVDNRRMIFGKKEVHDASPQHSLVKQEMSASRQDTASERRLLFATKSVTEKSPQIEKKSAVISPVLKYATTSRPGKSAAAEKIAVQSVRGNSKAKIMDSVEENSLATHVIAGTALKQSTRVALFGPKNGRDSNDSKERAGLGIHKDNQKIVQRQNNSLENTSPNAPSVDQRVESAKIKSSSEGVVSVRANTSNAVDVYAQHTAITRNLSKGITVGFFAESTSNKFSADLNLLPLFSYLSQKTGLVITPSYGFSKEIFKQQILENKFGIIYIGKGLQHHASSAGYMPFSRLTSVPQGKADNAADSYAWWTRNGALEEGSMKAFRSALSSLKGEGSVVARSAANGHANAVGVDAKFEDVDASEAKKLLKSARTSEVFRPGIDFDESLARERRNKGYVYSVSR